MQIRCFVRLKAKRGELATEGEMETIVKAVAPECLLKANIRGIHCQVQFGSDR